MAPGAFYKLISMQASINELHLLPDDTEGINLYGKPEGTYPWQQELARFTCLNHLYLSPSFAEDLQDIFASIDLSRLTSLGVHRRHQALQILPVSLLSLECDLTAAESQKIMLPTSLTSLKIDQGVINSDSPLRLPTSLRALTLSTSSLPQLEALMAFHTQLTRLALSDTPFDLGKSSHFEHLTQLQDLFIRFTRPQSEFGVPFQSMTQLTKLSLQNLSPEKITWPVSFPHLQNFSLFDCSEAVLNSLPEATYPELRRLYIVGRQSQDNSLNGIVPSAWIKWMSQLPLLEDLTLQELSGWWKGEPEAFLEALPRSLRSLMLVGMFQDIECDAFWASLGRFESLAKLSLSRIGAPCNVQPVLPLSLKKWECYHLENAAIANWMDWLADLPQLETVLTNYYVSESKLIELYERLPQLRRVVQFGGLPPEEAWCVLQNTKKRLSLQFWASHELCPKKQRFFTECKRIFNKLSPWLQNQILASRQK